MARNVKSRRDLTYDSRDVGQIPPGFDAEAQNSKIKRYRKINVQHFTWESARSRGDLTYVMRVVGQIPSAFDTETELMTNIRRYYKKGQIYFISCVTYNRKRILTQNIDLFWESIDSIKQKLNLDIISWVIIPDHFHMIIDPKGSNLSDIVKRIKLSFSKKYNFEHKPATRRIWQYRFWDHIIRDQRDMNRHIDYIHYNPVKHNLVKSPFDYEFSSIEKYRDYYSEDWGIREILDFDGEFGE